MEPGSRGCKGAHRTDWPTDGSRESRDIFLFTRSGSRLGSGRYSLLPWASLRRFLTIYSDEACLLGLSADGAILTCEVGPYIGGSDGQACSSCHRDASDQHASFDAARIGTARHAISSCPYQHPSRGHPVPSSSTPCIVPFLIHFFRPLLPLPSFFSCPVPSPVRGPGLRRPLSPRRPSVGQSTGPQHRLHSDNALLVVEGDAESSSTVHPWGVYGWQLRA